MGRVAELAEGYWTGAISPRQRHPFMPLLVSEEVAKQTLFVSSFANVTALATDRGLVLVDTGSQLFAEQIYEAVRAWSDAPVHTAIFTHGHIDHVFGIERFDAEAREDGRPPIRVVAHQAVPLRFDRYQATAGYNSCINSRQFSMPVQWPTQFREPDETYASQLTLSVAGLDLELHHARGETDDHTWVWVPSTKVLCTGDLFIWAVPNAGNPQKVQRYPREWAQALRRMSALGAEVMCPGHGVPIFGADRIRQALDDTAELLEGLHDRALALMNAGARLDEIVREVTAPAHLRDRPYLQPVYDEPEFIVRNVWRLYGGWWDGDPASLKPPPASALAREVAELSGGAGALLARAEARAEAGEWALACQLAEWAARAAPHDPVIARGRAFIYRGRAQAETSLVAKAIYREASELAPLPTEREMQTLPPELVGAVRGHTPMPTASTAPTAVEGAVPTFVATEDTARTIVSPDADDEEEDSRITPNRPRR